MRTIKTLIEEHGATKDKDGKWSRPKREKKIQQSNNRRAQVISKARKKNDDEIIDCFSNLDDVEGEMGSQEREVTDQEEQEEVQVKKKKDRK